MGITVKSRLLQAPCPATLIDGNQAVRLRMDEAGMDGTGGGTASKESHIAIKVTNDGRKFRRPLLSIPTQIAEIG